MDAVALALIDAALRGTLVALLLVFAGVLLRDRPPSSGRTVAIAMALGLCVQTFASTPWLETNVALAARAPLIALSVGNAPLFWLFVASLVDDDFVLRRHHVAIWAGVVAYAWFVMAGVVGSGSPATPWCLLLQRAISPFFSLLAAVTAMLNWRADLVERRRRLRGFVVVMGVGYGLLMVLLRARTPHGMLVGGAATLDVLLPLVIVGVIAGQLLRLGGSDVFLPIVAPRMPDAPGAESPTVAAAHAEGPPPAETAAADPAATAAADPAEQRLADALQHAMAVERAYRTEDLTVALLATRLKVPEYRLRRLINQRLGHRNFNAFVNGFRLADARAALADPVKRDLPILTIALDAGFGSIGPFNRAFKAATGVTPGEFRRENIADS